MGFFAKLRSYIKKVPIVGSPLASVYGVAIAPAALAESIASGARLDHALINNFKGQVADLKAIAPYAATVVSFVPGVGQGVSGAMGAALALANGQPLSAAVMSGIQGAVPGGTLAKGAFGAAAKLAQGKGIDEAALSALPLPDAQKAALKTALSVAAKISKGEKVSDTILTSALKQLPPDVAKAVHVGMAVGHAAKIQKQSHVAAKKVTNVLNGVNSKDPAKRGPRWRPWRRRKGPLRRATPTPLQC